jgi:hypothetical protein
MAYNDWIVRFPVTICWAINDVSCFAIHILEPISKLIPVVKPVPLHKEINLRQF